MGQDDKPQEGKTVIEFTSAPGLNVENMAGLGKEGFNGGEKANSDSQEPDCAELF